MKRCSFCEWIPILPMPVWPLAGQCALGQNVVVGSMALLLAVRGNIATRSMSGPPCALQLHRTTVWCGATLGITPSAGRARPQRPPPGAVDLSARLQPALEGTGAPHRGDTAALAAAPSRGADRPGGARQGPA